MPYQRFLSLFRKEIIGANMYTYIYKRKCEMHSMGSKPQSYILQGCLTSYSEYHTRSNYSNILITRMAIFNYLFLPNMLNTWLFKFS